MDRFFKSLKPCCLSRNRKKNWPGRAEPGAKFYILFQAGPGSGRNFNFSFGPLEKCPLAGPGPKIFFFTSGQARARLQPCRPGRAGPDLKSSTSADLQFEPQITSLEVSTFFFSYSHVVEKLLFSSEMSEKEISTNLHILRFPETENHIFSACIFVCVFCVFLSVCLYEYSSKKNFQHSKCGLPHVYRMQVQLEFLFMKIRQTARDAGTQNNCHNITACTL